MSNFHGIILYSIELDGCLNGVWTNQPNEGEIRNEIAKRIEVGSDEIAGTYKSTYIEIDNAIHNGKLTIRREKDIRQEDLDNVYSFIWEYESGSFSGIGYKMNKHQIAVHYCIG